MRERQKKKKGRTWAEAAKTVLEKYPNTPMSHKEILQVIQRERLKEISGTSPLACLNAMLHTNSRGEEGIFYKVPGRMGVYTLKKDISDVVKELSEEEDDEDEEEDGSDESSDDLSDSPSSENNSKVLLTQECRSGRWRRRVPTKLETQPSSPQPRCSSPLAPPGKLISPSQKHSKKALKQALKQQQQRNQRRQGGMPAASSPRLILKTVKDMADNITTKTDLCHGSGPRKMSQRTSRLSPRQLKRTKCEIDVETPDSILVNTNLRAIINKHTFSVLPLDCQQRLLKLLPEVDQQACMDGLLKVTSSALNNEFFASAAQSWKERLAEGEFTPELQLRMRQEIEKEKKVEQWKEAFFENYYGENSGLSYEESQRELMQADPGQEADRPRSPLPSPPPHHHHRSTAGPAIKAAPESKGSKDSSLAVSPALAGDQTRPLLQEPARTQPIARQMGAVMEPMRTRRAQHAEDRRLSRSAPPEPAVPGAILQAPTSPPEVQSPAEDTKNAKTLVVEQEPDVQPEKREPAPDSPDKSSPLPSKSSQEAEEDSALSSGGQPGKGGQEAVPVPTPPPGAVEPGKRKSPSEPEGEKTPEKRPRTSSASSTSPAVSSPSPIASITSPIASSTPTAVSSTSPVASLTSPVASFTSPVASFTSPVASFTSPVASFTSLVASFTSPSVVSTFPSVSSTSPMASSNFTSASATSPAASATSPAVSTMSPVVSCTSSPTTPSPTADQKVPPLKIPVSRILPVPVSPGPVYPRTPLPAPLGSPGRTGARTLADIKAKAQLARAQRAAAAAVAAAAGSGMVPAPKGPLPGAGAGPASGSGEKTPESSTLSPPSPQPSLAVLPPPPTVSQTRTLPTSSHMLEISSRLKTGEVPTSQVKAIEDIKQKSHSAIGPSASYHCVQKPSDLSSRGRKGLQEMPSTSTGLPARVSSCTPANNPLVTQLLQGKEVPIDQILPKPLAREAKGSGTHSGSKGKTWHSSAGGSHEHRPDKQGSAQPSLAGRHGAFPDHHARFHRDTPDKETQEQILQAVMQRKGSQQGQTLEGMGRHPPHYDAHQQQHQEDSQARPRFSVGFLGRKRTTRPAMTGHYLLNVSTYGRGSESSRRLQRPPALLNAALLSSVKREQVEGHEDVKDEELTSLSSGVKEEEQQGCSVAKQEESTIRVQHCLKVKTESSRLGCGSADTGADADRDATEARAKDGSPSPQLNQRNLQRSNSNQGNSEPYVTAPHPAGADPSHQRPHALQTQKKLDNQDQDAAVGSRYGGTINMSVPHAATGTTGSPASQSEPTDVGGVHGSVMSFSVTVTTIPTGRSLDHNNPGEPLPEQTFIEGAGMEDVQSKCYCRLKAMIMCKGCGAFCHDDCIGPSKLCVSCLVVR
ncbi:putative Polycomb group protein ASXL2 [Merluccius polli]|uniref:Polycomb group protein ASXL2 n=1 Tax=Merluccius polli TaxID=89951 RepID=A0AA47N9N5_MERPO|nr:putative Polycomb group protein ASXL2 [Merluccius polli]